MKIATNILDLKEFILISKRIENERAFISAVRESERVGLVKLTREDSDWEVESFYSTYDSTGNLTRRLWSSISQLPFYSNEIDSLDLSNILFYLDKD